MYAVTLPEVPRVAAVVAGAPRARQRKLPRFRIVCQGDGGKITLRTKGADKYEAFERIIMFLREKEFDYEVVLVEPS
ncbi:MAG TPA: hypothetical protein VEZ40_06600 [Pyrinomonadaceae bacterium]|nr:hypothetical protein [Pyrinomonadaceae bacterium]